MRPLFLLGVAACSLVLAGCALHSTTAPLTPASSVVGSPTSSGGGLVAGQLSIHPHIVQSSATAAEWQWQIQGAGSGAPAGSASIDLKGEQPTSVALAPDGGQPFECTVTLRIAVFDSKTLDVSETIHLSLGDTTRTQSSNWQVAGTLNKSFKPLVKKDTKDELPRQITLATLNGHAIEVRLGK